MLSSFSFESNELIMVFKHEELTINHGFTDGWEEKWVKSDWKKDENMAGDWIHTAGNWSANPNDRGITLIISLFV